MLTISGNNTSRIFYLVSTVDVFTINDLTIADGNVEDNGGGIFNEGFLIINDSVISNNIATGSGGGVFNKIFDRGDPTILLQNLWINRTDFISNQSGGGGGLYIQSSSEAIINNSSFTGNSTSGYGGAILNDGILRYTSGNILNNQAVNGGGIANGVISEINDLF